MLRESGFECCGGELVVCFVVGGGVVEVVVRVICKSVGVNGSREVSFLLEDGR